MTPASITYSTPNAQVGAVAPSNANLTALEANRGTPVSPATAGNLVAAMGDGQGRTVTQPHGCREMHKVATLTITDNSSHTLIAAGAAGIFNDITGLVLTNSSAGPVTVAVSDGTVTMTFGVGPQVTPTVIPIFIPASSAATAWTIQVSTGVISIYAVAVYVATK